jgi:hypothetical protein
MYTPEHVSQLITEAVKTLEVYHKIRDTASAETRESQYAYFCGLRKAIQLLGYRKELDAAMHTEDE